jgi:hypothetical protein
MSWWRSRFDDVGHNAETDGSSFLGISPQHKAKIIDFVFIDLSSVLGNLFE